MGHHTFSFIVSRPTIARIFASLRVRCHRIASHRRRLKTFRAHASEVVAVVYLNRTVLSTSWDGTVMIQVELNPTSRARRVPRARALTYYYITYYYIRRFAFHLHKDDSGDADEATRSTVRVLTLPPLTDGACLAASRSLSLIAVGTNDGSVCIYGWDFSGKMVAECGAHDGDVSALVFLEQHNTRHHLYPCPVFITGDSAGTLRAFATRGAPAKYQHTSLMTWSNTGVPAATKMPPEMEDSARHLGDDAASALRRVARLVYDAHTHTLFAVRCDAMREKAKIAPRRTCVLIF